METPSEEPLNFLESLITEKREECEIRLLEKERYEKKISNSNDEYKELSRQLQILSQDVEKYKGKNGFFEELHNQRTKTNDSLRRDIISKSRELKEVMIHQEMTKEKYVIASREEKSLKTTFETLEIEIKENQSITSSNKSKLVEKRKKEKFYVDRIKQLEKDIAFEERKSSEYSQEIQRLEKQTLNHCALTSQIESNVSQVRKKISKQLHSIESYREIDREICEKVIFETKRLSETKQEAKRLYQTLREKDREVKAKRQEQEDALELLLLEKEKLIDLRKKEKIIQSNVKKMSNNDTKLDQEIALLDKTRTTSENAQKRLRVGLDQQMAKARAKKIEVESLKKDIQLEKDRTNQMGTEYYQKKDQIHSLKKEVFNLNNEIIMTKKENEKTESQILEFNSKIKDLTEKYHSKIKDLKSIENLLHSNLSLYEDCNKEMVSEL